ncbi:hypothetical protein [Opitutus terrae]|uniref:Uncharacterized protein n=1 Tax=Opitutus terrae (strain DSM 11246 / JCM 15787 / PB90-1) TaxID=452637 RepID=B1ZT85_OPITP|nr:hypothetical protein [Opitutus terrae]ACB76539.1 hypothetical protein Oter_3260 [Opitutus terrae PB90-1]
MSAAPLLPTADLFIEPPARSGDDVEYVCRLAEPRGTTHRIWFRFPASCEPLLTRRADPFVLATLIYSLGRIGRLEIHGAVSQGLLANVADFQSAYAAFHRVAAAPVRLVAREVVSAATANRTDGGITAFSGGVDSCFSVFRHTSLSELEPKRPLRAALMMHGFDIPLAEPAMFARAATRARTLTESAGVRLFTGATNLRTLPGHWEDTFGTAVAAVLTFFQPAFVFGLVPSAQLWQQVHFDHGSNPLTDPLLSSGAFAIVHDGTSFGRIDKLRALAAWPEALRLMRVCWEGRHLDANCGRCEKCLRTMLMLRICGVDAPAAFPPLDLAALDRLVIRTRGGLDEFAYLISEARRRNITEPWVAAAEGAVRRSRRAAWLKARARRAAGWLPAAWRNRLQRVRHPAVATASAPPLAEASTQPAPVATEEMLSRP